MAEIPQLVNDRSLFQHDNRRLHDEAADFDLLPPTVGWYRDPESDRMIFGKLSDEEYDRRVAERGIPITHLDLVRASFTPAERERLANLASNADDPIEALGLADELAAVEAAPEVLAWGEGYIGYARRLSEMPGLDRVIAIDCHNGSGGVQRQSLNVPNIGRRNKFEMLARRLDCTLDQAEDFIACWRVIDDSGRLWDEFERWTATRGVEKALAWFWSMAEALTDDEIVNEREIASDTPFWGSEVEDIGSLDAEDAPELSMSDDEAPAAAEPVAIETASADLVDLERAFERIGWEDEQGVYHLASHTERLPAPEVFRYVNINNDRGETSILPPWKSGEWAPFWTTQPRPAYYQRLVRAIDRCPKLVKLAAVRKAYFDGRLLWMSRGQRNCFWNAVKNRQALLDGRKRAFVKQLLASASRLEGQKLSEMANAKSVAQARYYWGLLCRAQNGELDMGRKNFIRFVLKPALSKRWRELERRPPQPPVAGPDDLSCYAIWA